MQRILMLGDSLVEWGNWTTLLPKWQVINRGIAGEALEELSARLADELEAWPERDVILLQSGTNNLLAGDGGYPSIYVSMLPRLRLLAPDCPLILCSLAPMPILPLRVISQINTELARCAATVKGCVFLDLVGPFSEYCLPITHPGFLNDQVHLSTRGYQVWARAIEECIQGRKPVNGKS